jgi:hypothetical protein
VNLSPKDRNDTSKSGSILSKRHIASYEHTSFMKSSNSKAVSSIVETIAFQTPAIFTMVKNISQDVIKQWF